MKKILFTLFTGLIPLLSIAQNEVQSYGKVSADDLTLKECSFEKDAHAMVLFDQADVYFDHQFDIVMERHKRIKIFNDKAKDAGDIRIEYHPYNHYEDLYDISAQTINYKDGKPVITKLEKKQIFSQPVDKYTTAIIFTFPDVQAGSIIEYKYKWRTGSWGNFPDWSFQSSIPVRYSELSTAIPDILYYKTQSHITVPYFKNKTSSVGKTLGTGQNAASYNEEKKLYALKDVPSLPDEPFMTSRRDNLQSLLFQLTQIRPIGGFVQTGTDTWPKVGERLAEDEDFGKQFRKKIEGEDIIIAKAQALKTDEDKIAFLFNEVKNAMKWNGHDNWYTNDGISKSWDKKTGNSTEINLILYRLLKQSNIKNAFPLVVSTRDHGKVNVAFPWLYQFNRTVVYVPIDSIKRYFLDATSKYNLYNTIPDKILNSYGIAVNKEEKSYQIIEITNPEASRKLIYINAQITPEGKMSGTANVSNFAYHKIEATEVFKKDGEEKFKDWLTDKNNSLKIKGLKMDGVEVDSLPLQKTIDFELDLNSAEGDYMYFVPNLFTGLRNNPFLSQNRSTLIDFGYKNKYSITGMYKLPVGYKIEGLPKNINMVMPDKSITFQRLVTEADGSISIRYVIDFKKTIYLMDEYPELWQFYKQMFELLNEQIVLKKS